VFLRKQASGVRFKPLLASGLLHGLLLYVLYSPLHFLDGGPSAVRLGQNGNSVELVYLTQLGAAQPKLNQEKAEKTPAFVLPRAAKKKPKHREPRKDPDLTTTAEAARAGSETGSLLDGPVSGHEVRPALPIQFADPDFHRLVIPKDVRGNVIARVRIDAKGNVVGVFLVEGLGHGIDEQVLEALLLWHYRPATLDGIAVPEQHLVVYPYPR
jgi:Gram-negative bacterial TonB protein C-terminal